MRLLLLAAALLAAGPALAQTSLDGSPSAPWRGGSGTSNDDVAFAYPLAPNAPAEARTTTTVGATPDPRTGFRSPSLGASCSASENEKDVWWYFRPTTTGTATLDLAGSSFDTVMSVYTSLLDEVGCNDDASSTVLQSRIANMPVTAGTLYYVRVSGFSTAEGTVQIAMTSAAVTTSPNDPYPPQLLVGPSFDVVGPRLSFNAGATATAGNPTPPPTCTTSALRSVWHGYVAAQTGFLTVDLSGSTLANGTTFDTVLLVTDVNGTILGCNDDGGAGTTSRLADIPVTASLPYYIGLYSFNNESGLFRLTTSFSTAVADEDDAAEAGFALAAPRPNPSAGAATLAFTLAAAGPARVALFDALGREVAVAFDGLAPAGETTVRADVSALPVGVYLARLTAGAGVATQRLTVVR